MPWNPGGTADLVTRMLASETVSDIIVKNVHGANGSEGLNEVHDAPHDGKTLLGTNLSAFVTAEYMGFTEHGYNDWKIWLAAYKTIDDLLKSANENPEKIVCANAGNGTLSFAAAHLCADSADITVKHQAYSGFNPPP